MEIELEFLIKIRSMVKGMKTDEVWDCDMQSAEILGMLDKKIEGELFALK